MEKIIIAAMAQNRTIGRDNALPWHIPEDLQLFKKTTMNSPMIMGRGTRWQGTAFFPGLRIIFLKQPEKNIRAAARISR